MCVWRVCECVCAFVRFFNKTQRGTMVLRTCDFSEMYTNIKFLELKSKMGKLMDWLFAFKRTSNKTHILVPRGKNARVQWLRYAFTDFISHTTTNKIRTPVFLVSGFVCVHLLECASRHVFSNYFCLFIVFCV